MRWLHIVVIALFVLATAFSRYKISGRHAVLPGFSARAPLALLVAIFYLLGMATGSSLFALLRRSIARSRFNAMTKS